MSHEERNNVVALIVSLAVNGWITLKLIGLFDSGVLDGPDGLQIWARQVLWVIPLCIVATIVVMILFSILFAIITRDSDTSMLVDERDKMFQMRGMIVTMLIGAFGFILALIALALGWQAVVAFTLIYYAFALGDFVGNTVKLLSYRLGG